MPHINKVDISSQPIVLGSGGVNNFDVTVTATIRFSEVEKKLD